MDTVRQELLKGQRATVSLYDGSGRVPLQKVDVKLKQRFFGYIRTSKNNVSIQKPSRINETW